MTDHSAQQPPTEQIRLALVLNGGISLAVWMAGVTFELDQCRTARSGTPSASRTAWAALLSAAHRSVAIDMIAGASAGGLNGVILGTAIARQAELTHLKRLWLDLAALDGGKLLAAEPDPRRQLLDGGFFQDKVAELLDQTARPGDPAATNLHGGADCSLLVTATALPTTHDASPDSRRVYRFRRRDGIDASTGPAVAPTDDFSPSPAVAEPLALAARATASFPAAFQPVVETAALQQRRMLAAPKVTATQGKTWLMDGGILDNAPFEPMLDELIARPVSGAFTRHLVYVNPSTPAPMVTSTGAGRVAPGPTITATIGATLGAFRQPDRRLDAERIAEAEEAAALRASQPDGLLEAMLLRPDVATLTRDQLSQAAAGAFGQYCASRLASYRVKYAIDHGVVPSGPPPFVPTAPPTGSAADPEWQWGLSTAERVLRWWGRIMAAVSAGERREAAYEDLYRAQLTVADWERQRAEVMGRLVGDTVARQGRAPDLDELLDGERGFYSASRRREIATLVTRTATSVAMAVSGEAQTKGAPTIDGPALLVDSLELDVFSSAIIRTVDRNAETPRFQRWTIDPGAPSPFAFAAGEDPTWPRQKLCGERWGAFGAFAAEDGRTWDYLWGRLDAATRLAETLLDGVALDEARKAELVDGVVTAIVAEEQTTRELIEATAAKMLQLDNAGLFAIYAIGLRSRAKMASAASTRDAALALVRAAPAIVFKANRDEVGGLPPLPAPARFLYRLVVRFIVTPRLLRRPKHAPEIPWRRADVVRG